MSSAASGTCWVSGPKGMYESISTDLPVELSGTNSILSCLIRVYQPVGTLRDLALGVLLTSLDVVLVSVPLRLRIFRHISMGSRISDYSLAHVKGGFIISVVLQAKATYFRLAAMQ